MRTPLVIALMLLPAASAAAYTTNVYWWEADQLPVPVELVRPGSEDLGEDLTEELVLESLDAWIDPACTTLSYEFRGWVDEVVYGDGVVQVEWIEEGANMGDAAASTQIQLDPDAGRLIDVNLSFNGETFTWVDGGSNPYLDVLDTRAVLVHEFGHLFGLDHGEMIEATMFYAYVSATTGYLSWDDKWGICTLYPGDGDECQVDADCPDHPLQGYRCREIPELGRKVCEEVYDGLGACCDADWNNCADALCAIHAPEYAGHCSQFCDDGSDCPEDWTCEAVSYLGQDRAWCVSPLGADQPWGDEFDPGDDDDGEGDDDDSGDTGPGDGGDCSCRQAPGGTAPALVLLGGLLGLVSYRRRR